MNIVGQSSLIMNTHKVAADLLNRRGPIYSNRPRFIGKQELALPSPLFIRATVASEILTGGLLVVFAQYNDL
jgi:hypothetical protein